ncbi:Formate dehydrogenase, cytochrome b556(fdo) subunit [Aliiroseovarius pelagivivens]|uniref:Formate dehydrogenase, cytochrome b556(Fdo) subunit n=1 Tax=Aliiroseovarius pelagivivens TaxID=1639690 RepID=A0A2R8AJM7_9RHOB|nr:formate dehydrogenase subunit gamma [Aliiroseovarius pelagivivens]SPF76077.1 Formate dehydrogenase, cytochrome b556(fdo) subunit [Aliiroseovarius pelagivivens]
MLRMALALVLMLTLAPAGFAQEDTPAVDRSATGGAQTLDDILARQAGQKLDDSFRSDAVGDPNGAAGIAAQLGTLGGVSDAETWRALRYGSANVNVSAGGDVATVLVQDGGMRWLEFRDTTLRTYGGWLLVGTLVALLAFYVLHGRIKIDDGRAGTTVTRFKAIERFGHWLLAGSFILLGVTGLLVLFGRVFLVPLFGKDANAFLLVWSKWVHNNVSWAFILGLVMIFVMWVVHNIPNRTDLHWLKKGGGILFGHDHPPAKKFNAGQKMIFWSVVLFGGSIALTGVSLLFPFDLPLFAKTFNLLNATGLPHMIGLGELQVQLAPQEEMQLAQAWHAILAFVLTAIVLAHIYIGSVGMEGAYDAMSSGEVDEAWAEQHHSIWLEEYKAAERDAEGNKAPQPAE